MRKSLPSFATRLLAPQISPEKFDELDMVSLAIESSPSPMVVTDPCQWDSPIVTANRSFLALTGYEANGVADRNCRFLQGEDVCQSALALIRAALDAERDFTVTLLNYRKDGTSFWNEIRVAHIFNAAGELAYYLGSQSGVSDVSSRALIETVRWSPAELMVVGRVQAIILQDQLYAKDIVTRRYGPSIDSPIGCR